MIVGLNNLKEEIKEKQLRELALAVVKYQNFKTESVLSKLNYNASTATKKNYFGCGIAYIKSNKQKKHKAIPEGLYTYIDEALERCVQPLVPSAEDRRQTYKARPKNYTCKNAVPPIAQLECVKQPLTERFEYGIKLSDSHIRMCPSRDYAQGYIDALRENNCTNAESCQIIAVNISTI